MKEVITKKQILWEELTTPNRTIDHQVTQTREKITDGSKQGTPYANFWDPELKYEDEELVRNALNLCRDHLVLDLGCGGQKRDSDYPSKEPKFLEVLRKEKISGVRYIGVDSFIIQECPNPWEDTETAERWGLEVTSEITPSVHKIDLLEALYHIKDTCEVHKKPLCIVMNGIDEDIIFDAPWEAIYQEIKRVLPIGSYFISNNAPPALMIDKNPDFKRVENTPVRDHGRLDVSAVWQKIA